MIMNVVISSWFMLESGADGGIGGAPGGMLGGGGILLPSGSWRRP